MISYSTFTQNSNFVFLAIELNFDPNISFSTLADSSQIILRLIFSGKSLYWLIFVDQAKMWRQKKNKTFMNHCSKRTTRVFLSKKHGINSGFFKIFLHTSDVSNVFQHALHDLMTVFEVEYRATNKYLNMHKNDSSNFLIQERISWFRKGFPGKERIESILVRTVYTVLWMFWIDGWILDIKIVRTKFFAKCTFFVMIKKKRNKEEHQQSILYIPYKCSCVCFLFLELCVCCVSFCVIL